MSVYRVIDVIGTSTQSWEDAAVTAVNTARKSLRDLRVAEVVQQDLTIGPCSAPRSTCSTAWNPCSSRGRTRLSSRVASPGTGW